MDGGDGLATAIGSAIVCMLAGSVVVLGALGWVIPGKKNGAVGATLGGSVWMFRFRPSNDLREPDLGMSNEELAARIRQLEGEGR